MFVLTLQVKNIEWHWRNTRQRAQKRFVQGFKWSILGPLQKQVSQWGKSMISHFHAMPEMLPQDRESKIFSFIFLNEFQLLAPTVVHPKRQNSIFFHIETYELHFPNVFYIDSMPFILTVQHLDPTIFPHLPNIFLDQDSTVPCRDGKLYAQNSE